MIIHQSFHISCQRTLPLDSLPVYKHSENVVSKYSKLLSIGQFISILLLCFSITWWKYYIGLIFMQRGGDGSESRTRSGGRSKRTK